MVHGPGCGVAERAVLMHSRRPPPPRVSSQKRPQPRPPRPIAAPNSMTERQTRIHALLLPHARQHRDAVAHTSMHIARLRDHRHPILYYAVTSSPPPQHVHAHAHTHPHPRPHAHGHGHGHGHGHVDSTQPKLPPSRPATAPVPSLNVAYVLQTIPCPWGSQSSATRPLSNCAPSAELDTLPIRPMSARVRRPGQCTINAGSSPFQQHPDHPTRSLKACVDLYRSVTEAIECVRRLTLRSCA